MSQILLVDDDQNIREILAFLLQDEGYQTQEAANLDAALALIDTTTFDLILTDIFAHAQGQEFRLLAALRVRAAPTPVAILSGWSLREDEARAAEFAFVMKKPFDIESLLTEIAAAMRTCLSPEEQERAVIAERYFAALGARDWDALMSLCADDVVYALPGDSLLCATVEGKAAFRAYTEETFAHFPAARFESVNTYATPGGLAVRYQAHWLSKERRDERQSGAAILHFVGRQICRIGIQLQGEQLRRLAETSA